MLPALIPQMKTTKENHFGGEEVHALNTEPETLDFISAF